MGKDGEMRERPRIGLGRSASASSAGSHSSTTKRTDSKTNLMGKFTQSVRRIVQDVRDEGGPSGQTKDEAIKANLQLRHMRSKLEVNYETAKGALVNLQDQYEKSKQLRNPIQRYPLLKAMIKEVIKLEQQYWALMDFPKQEKGESVPVFVLRACSALDNVKSRIEKRTEMDEKTKEEKERLEDMTTSQIEAENTQQINDLYRLLKRYIGLRTLIRALAVGYYSSRYYPFFPRYNVLKELIKEMAHDPNYMEVRHEHSIITGG